MGQEKLLDCTLRDGAYLVDKYFGDTVISGVIAGLVAARIDYIEIGFLQDDGFGEGKTVFKDAADAKRFIPEDKRLHNRFRASKPDDVLTIGTEETSRAFIPVRNILYVSMGSEEDI